MATRASTITLKSAILVRKLHRYQTVAISSAIKSINAQRCRARDKLANAVGSLHHVEQVLQSGVGGPLPPRACQAASSPLQTPQSLSNLCRLPPHHLSVVYALHAFRHMLHQQPKSHRPRAELERLHQPEQLQHVKGIR